MVNPVVGGLALAKVSTLAWWTIHLAKTRSLSKANRAVADDWDALTGYGSEVVSFAKAVGGLNALEAKDFRSFVVTVRDSKKMLSHFSPGVQKFLESKFRISATLEEESRIAYVHYAAALLNDESGTSRARINRLYQALYIMGRTDWPLSVSQRDGTYIRLMQAHTSCVGRTLDAKLLSALERLQSSTAQQFERSLRQYLGIHDKKRRMSSFYIVHALMPLSCGTLGHAGVADEIASLYGAK